MVCLSDFCISRVKKTKQILLVRGKFSFLDVDIWFYLTMSIFIVKNSSFKNLVVLSPIFVVDIKKTFVYNFVAPLKIKREKHTSEVYLEPCQTSNMKLFKKVANDFKPFLIFAKSFILDI